MACGMIEEAQAERAERDWREAHFGQMTLEAQEAHARRYRVYGALSQTAQREAMAIKRVARLRREAGEMMGLALAGTGIRYCGRTPRNGRSALEAPIVRKWRYPRQKAIAAWLRILAGVRGSKDEIVTAGDRKRRRNKRMAKSLLRVAPAVVESDDGLEAMEKLVAAIRARRGAA